MKMNYFVVARKDLPEYSNKDGILYCVYGVAEGRNIKSLFDNENIVIAHLARNKKNAIETMQAWIKSNGSEWQKRYGGYIINNR